MILGSSELIKLIEKSELVTNLGADFKIEGATIDFRLDTVNQHLGGAQLFEKSRNTGNVISVQSKNGIFTLRPNNTYLMSTMERVNMPTDLIGHIDYRTTMFRSGITMGCTYINPGYCGQLTVMVHNNTNVEISIERGFRIVQVAFMQLVGTSEPYNGQWQNGKIHTNNEFVAPR